MLFDPGVSRSHARVFEKDGRFFCEDLGSSHGTKVNGAEIKGQKALSEGDTLAVGNVVFAFAPLKKKPDPLQNAKANPFADDPTRIKEPVAEEPSDDEPVPRGPKSIEERIAEPAPPGQETRIIEVAATSMRPAGKLAPSSDESDHRSRTEEVELAPLAPPSPRGLASKDASDTEAQMPAVSAKGPGMTTASGGRSAAERARLKRDLGQTIGGQLTLLWVEMSLRGKLFAGGIALLLLSVGLGSVAYVFWPESVEEGEIPPEPGIISRRPIKESFGLGEGVTYPRPDMKLFDFEFVSPTRAVAVLHFQASSIGTNEVSVAVNGADQGFLPADTAEAVEHDHELVFAASLLKKGEPNQVIFDNAKNPPGEDSWRIWNLWIEVVPIPELPQEQLLAQAQEAAKKGKDFSDRRSAGTDNVFRAWKSFRNAWLTLEAMDERPEMYAYVRDQLDTLGRELDAQCGKMMLEVQRSLQLKNKRKAVRTLEDVPRYFPTAEHRCHNLALERLAELE